MTARSLRVRAIVGSAVAVLLALFVAGAAVDVLVSRHLHRSLDRTLRARAVDVAQLSASAPALLTSPGALDAPLGGQQLDVQVVDRHGRIVARSLALGGRVLPVASLARRVVADGVGRYANVDLGSDHLRAYVAPLAETGGPAAAAGDDAVEVVAPKPVQVRGDRPALERALANLLENARRYGPAGGRITVEARSADGAARLSVRDEGAGLQPYEAARAFERFWRGRSDAGGSGLGLAIVEATAERHGGRAYADGSTFTIELPALRELSESPATTRVESSPKGSP